MIKHYLSYLFLFIACSLFGQTEDSIKWYRHDISYNLAPLASNNGPTLQIGYSYELDKKWAMAVELGWVGEPILKYKGFGISSGIGDYSGIRIRPQIQFHKNLFHEEERSYIALMYNYQYLEYIDNKDFLIEEGNGFVQNISYKGKLINNAIYLVKGWRFELQNRITLGMGCGIGWMHRRYKVDTPIPDNAVAMTPFSFLSLFRSKKKINHLNRSFSHLAFTIDFKVGYIF